MLKFVRALLVATLILPSILLAAAETPAASSAEDVAKATSSEPIIMLERFVTVDYSQTEVAGKGFGEGRATVSVPAVDIAVMPAGQNPILLLGKTPGINVQSSDNIGLYEHANRIQIRAFNINQIGVTLDGVPMGQQNFYGGTPVDRLVDSESIERVDVSTGIGSVWMPANAALGGAIRYYTKAPKDEMAAQMSVSFGDNNYRRGFVRIDTGEVIKNLTAFFSHSTLTAIKWRGYGDIFRDHFAAQLRYLVGNHEFKLKVDYNDRGDHDYRSMSLAIYNQIGRFYEYPTTIQGRTPSGAVSANDAAYWDNQFNYRRDTVISLESIFNFSADLTLSIIPYYDKKFLHGGGNQDGTTGAPKASYDLSIASTPNDLFRDVNGVSYQIFAPKGVLFSQRVGEQERYGVPVTLVWQTGSHQLTTAGWYQRDFYRRADVRWNRANGLAGGENLEDVEFVYGNHDVFHHFYTTQLAVEDRFKLIDHKLTVTAGFKALHITDTFHGYKNADDYARDIQSAFSATYEDTFLPSLGLTYDLSKTSQLFTSYAENMAQPVKEVYYVATYPAKPVNAETSQVAELGWRFTKKKLNLTVAGYLVKYGHRLLSFNDFDPTSSRTVATFADVGGITSKGVEAAFAYFPIKGLRFSTSFSYNDTTFDEDYYKANSSGTGTVLVPTKGKVVPDFPEVMVNAEINYNWKSLYSGIDYRYMSRRYSTSTNVESVEGYGVYNLFLGYQATSGGKLGHLRVQFNVSNLFDHSYLGSISSGETTGSFQPGAPRTMYLAVSTSF